MDKKKINNIFYLVIALFAILTAIFTFVEAIKSFSAMGDYGNSSLKYNSFFIIQAIILLAVTVSICLFSVKSILPILKNNETVDNSSLIIMSYALYEVLINIIAQCYFGFNNTARILLVIFGVITFVCLIVERVGKLEKNYNLVLHYSSLVALFVIIILGFVYTSGIYVVKYVFLLLTLLAIAAQLVCNYVLDNNSNNKKIEDTKVETNEESSNNEKVESTSLNESNNQ